MYLTQAEYTDITGETATVEELTHASRLLDARIGYYPQRYDGWKLNLDFYPLYVVDAVKQWVAFMTTSLISTGGSPELKEDSISLGRFSVDYDDSSSGNSKLPNSMQYVDAQLIDAGLINRSVPTRC